MVSWKTLTQFWFSDHVPVSRILLELAYILDKIYILMSYKLIEFESLESEKYLYLYLSVDFGCTRRLENPWISEPAKSVYALMRRVSCLFMRHQQQTASINLCISHYGCEGGPRPTTERPCLMWKMDN